MASIIIPDLDDRMFDGIVKHEYVTEMGRVCYAHSIIMGAFDTIAGEDVCVRTSDQFSFLSKLADEAAEQWVDYFNSRGDRRAVLRKMFPIAVPRIQSIPPTPIRMPLKSMVDIQKDLMNTKTGDLYVKPIDFNAPIDVAALNATNKKLQDIIKQYIP